MRLVPAARKRAWAAALMLIALAAPASAEPLRIGTEPASLELDLDAGWRAEPGPAVPDAPALVVRGPGAIGAVTVAMAPNPDAWVEATRRAYLDAVVAGFTAQPGVRVRRRTDSLVAGVPCIDLALVRDRRRVAVRLLLFRTRTIALVIEGASSAAALVPTVD